MPLRSMRSKNDGVGGFFEDVPTLIIVILGFGIFLLSIVNAFVAYQAQQDRFRMHQECVEFSEAIRSYEGLTYESMEGVLDGDKILNESMDSIKEDFNPAYLKYDYRIIIKDVSNYSDRNNYTTSFYSAIPPAKQSKYSVSSSVVIRVDGNYHSGQMVITIW